MLVFEYRVAVEMKDGNRIPLDCNLVNLHIVVVGPSAGFNHIQLYGFSNSSLYVHAITATIIIYATYNTFTYYFNWRNK